MGRYPVWITKDKQRIPINKMTDSHLLNTIEFLERLAQRVIYLGYQVEATLQGEMACQLMEDNIRYMEEYAETSELLGGISSRLEYIYLEMYKLAYKKGLFDKEEEK